MSFPIDHHLLQLADLLQSQNAILCTHPNDLDLSTLPDSWTVPPRSLLDYYMTGALDAKASDKIPDDLKNLLDSIRTLQLPRSPLNISEHWLVSLESTKGMSPKKIHEVRQMASYIKALVELNSGFRNPHHPDVPLHIVDVGSGQGYLTRTLASLFPDARVLALDADEGQTIGAELKLGKENKRHPSANTNPRITHKTVLITPESLIKSVDDWVTGTHPKRDAVAPVLFVALHACGSLTPDILRAFVSATSRIGSDNIWYPCSTVAVGCCYNLMYPGDYPLSKVLRSHQPLHQPLPASAYHLAAQIPEAWLVPNPAAPISGWKMQPSMELATRKIVWRALLGYALRTPFAKISTDEAEPATATERVQAKCKKSAEVPVKWWLYNEPMPNASHASRQVLSEANGSFKRLPSVVHADPQIQQQQTVGVGQTATAMRLGKLPDSAYRQGWHHFLDVAGKKLGVKWNLGDGEATSTLFDTLRSPELEQKIETLHFLRCLLGPVVESSILLDRLVWLQEQLCVGDRRTLGHTRCDNDGNGSPWSIELVNLFDQKSGSGRNVGICMAPILPHDL